MNFNLQVDTPSAIATSTTPSTAAATIVIIDDHQMILGGTIAALQRAYPEAEVVTAQNSRVAWEFLVETEPDLLVTDLAIPNEPDAKPQTEHGLELLRSLMGKYPNLNIVVQSAHAKSLVRLKPSIDLHQGGFTVVDKGASLSEMLKKVDWAIQGIIFTPREMRHGLEIKPEWLEVLVLAFAEGLQDKAIAQKMHIAERTVRHYWSKLQDALEVYPEEGHNIRIQTQLRAREEGLID